MTQALHGEREAGDAIGEGAVAVEVAAGGEVAGERRGALPHLAAALGVAVVLLGELLVVDDPEALGEKEEEEQRGEALGPADLDAGKLHAAGLICMLPALSAFRVAIAASRHGLKRASRRPAASRIFECIVRDMQSLSFTPGRAFLSSDSPTVPWTVVFEDEGVAGYFYACDRSQETHEDSILDAMLIYNVAALAKSDAENEAA